MKWKCSKGCALPHPNLHIPGIIDKEGGIFLPRRRAINLKRKLRFKFLQLGAQFILVQDK